MTSIIAPGDASRCLRISTRLSTMNFTMLGQHPPQHMSSHNLVHHLKRVHHHNLVHHHKRVLVTESGGGPWRMENRMSKFGHLEDLMLQGQGVQLELDLRFLWHPHISTLARVK